MSERRLLICMTFRSAALLAALLVFVGVGRGNPGGPGGPGGQGGPRDRLLSLYSRADSLYRLSHSTPVTDSMALAGFGAVIEGFYRLPGHRDRDTVLAGALLRKGILLDAAGNYPGAKASYISAMNASLPNDSISFVAGVNVGGIYYYLNHFDSANYFLLQARALVNKFNDRDDQARVYNLLGVLYYDNGNYREARGHFNKALELLREKKPLDTTFAVSLQTNIATSSFRLGEYQKALAAYRQLLEYQPMTNLVNMNMGNAYAGLSDYTAALACYRKVDTRKLPWVWNEIANAQEQLHRSDSCVWYLRRLQAVVQQDPAKVYVVDVGINAQYEAKWLGDQGEYERALGSLQKAIIIFSRNFNNSDIYSNPVNFTGTVAGYRLFDALVDKATFFRQLYKARPDAKYLRASYAAYTSALSLLRYIEKSYATDEAKLFLKKKSGPVHADALAVCLRLHGLYPHEGYMEQAFGISEKSKASVITASLEEKAFTTLAGTGQELLQKVNDAKYNIARLNIKSEQAKDNAELAGITREKEANELELSRLENALEQNGEYYQLKYGDASPGVSELQQELRQGQALISLFAADSALHVWVVTKNTFSYLRLDSLDGLQADVGHWLEALKTAGNGHRFRGDVFGDRLYRRLIRPIQGETKGEDEWIVVPDGFLYLLPWESLPADAGGEHRLVETTTISYQWSSRLLGAGHVEGGKGGSGAAAGVSSGAGQGGTAILGFAPFASQGGDSGFSRLPASAEEIAGLKGMEYLDSHATKAEFLRDVNNYPIVHLATHAVSSPDDAAASFIAFYPARHSAIEDRLYLEELYGLNLRTNRLVIISACETGEGEVVAQEGVMSLARAFAYAGCGSTINSLWKADDKATSYILRRFYVYLEEGKTKARALQLAKIDYLKSDALDKSPAFWAHLVLTGDPGPLYDRGSAARWLWLLVPLGGVVLWVGGRKRGRKKKSTI